MKLNETLVKWGYPKGMFYGVHDGDISETIGAGV